MTAEPTSFQPFYDRLPQGPRGFRLRIGMALGSGLAYGVLLHLALSHSAGLIEHQGWILAVILSVAMLSLYIATALFRANLPLVLRLQGREPVIHQVVQRWLTDRGYLYAGVGFGALNALVGHVLGIPEELAQSPGSITVLTLGYALVGFTCGMGLFGITGVMVLYLRLAPCLYFSLDPLAPDGAGGIKRLGDALWTFALLTLGVGVLVSAYLLGVEWRHVESGLPRWLLMGWLAMPYVAAVSMVLIPGLAVRRNVMAFKSQRLQELRREHARIYGQLKEFHPQGDHDIISAHQSLTDQLNHIQSQLSRLQSLRDAHLDRS